MRVLVTGGAGFIGARLSRALVSAGHEVVVVDDLSACPDTRLLGDTAADVRLSVLDIREAGALARLPAGGFDRVYHLASSFANVRSLEQPDLDFETNVTGTTNVLDFARQRGCGLFVYAGSSSSYGASCLPADEDGPLEPQTPYARTKHAGEQRVRESGLPFAVLRLFNVYGPGDYPGRYRNVIPNFARAAAGPDPRLTIYGDGATRDFTFVDDVLRFLLEADAAAGHTVNVGTGVETPIDSLARRVAAHFGVGDDAISVAPSRSWDGVIRRRAKVAKLHELYGETPATRIDEGLPSTLEWLEQSGFLSASGHEAA